MHECELCEKSFICELDKHIHNAWLKKTRLGMIRKTIVVTSNKGGCGLTLFSLLLAAKIKQKGYKTALIETSLSSYLPYYMGFDGTEGLDIVPGGIVPPVSTFGYPYLSPLLFMGNSPKPLFWDKEATLKFIKKMIINTNWGDVDILLLDMPFCQAEMIKDLISFMGDKLSQSVLLLDEKSRESAQAKVYTSFIKEHTSLLKVVSSPSTVQGKVSEKKTMLPFVDDVCNSDVLLSEVPAMVVDAYDEPLEEVSKVCLSIF
jgi:Mrp family chromosome partitioning ATPase